MRALLLSTVAVIAFGLAAAQAQVSHRPQDNTPQQDATSSAANENQKANQSLSNAPQSGRTEPSATNAASAHQTGTEQAVFVNGMLNAPGAPTDSQTRPAKFSQHNDEIDKQPIMTMRLARLDDAQRRAIMDAVGKANAPVASTQAKPSEELPMGLEINELPRAAANAIDMKGLKYVRLSDGILLVDAPNRIVVGEIKK